MILDTRGDPVEARARYSRPGCPETGPHNAAPYADHWFVRPLRPLRPLGQGLR